MSRILDLDTKESEWLKEIEKRKAIVQECDMTIANAQAKKQEAMEEIGKYQLWIQTAREMFGILPPVTEQVENDENMKALLEGISLRQAVINLLRESEKELTATEITKQLMDGGFPTKSINFRNVVQNRLHSFVKDKSIFVNKKDGENYYTVMKRRRMPDDYIQSN